MNVRIFFLFLILLAVCLPHAATAAQNSRVLLTPTPTPPPVEARTMIIPTATTQAPAAVGALSLDSIPPGASVIIDGVVMGTTPFTSRTLGVGTHSLILRVSGYQDYSTQVTIQQDYLNRQTYTLVTVPVAATTPTPVNLQAVTPPVTVATTVTPVKLVSIPVSTVFGDDADKDSIPNDKDNCPSVFNPGQDEADREFIGCPLGAVAKFPDAGAMALCAELTSEAARKKCEENAFAKANPGFTGAWCNYKSDGKGNPCDNCWEVQNIDQVDSDGDCASYKNKLSYWDGTKWLKDPQCGDDCDKCPNSDNTLDSDKDGIPDGCDNCWNKPNADQKDSDDDCSALKQDTTIWDAGKLVWKADPHCGDACDNCVSDWNPGQMDIDNNSIGDACDCTDQFQGPYEESWDCGIKTYMGHTGHGCLNQKCKPCDLIQNGQLPQKFSWRNWRGKDWTSYVLNQGACGSCWAESAIGVTEARYYIENNKAKSMTTVWLSEQHLVSWKPEYPMGSCKGGHNPEAIDYLYEFGVANYTEFQYTSGKCLDADDNCVTDCQSPYGSHCSKPGGVPSGPTDWLGRRWHISGYNSIATGNVYAAQPSPNYVIKQTILCQGPLSVSSSNWGGGHSFLLVGYNDINKTWIVENSWGSGWEDGGYAEISETDPRVDIADMWSRGSGIWYVAGVWHG